MHDPDRGATRRCEVPAHRSDDYISGVDALALVPALQARRDRATSLNTAALVTGYPGSPLGGFLDSVSRVAAAHHDLPIEVRPALNEEFAATAVFGSQVVHGRAEARYDGVTGYWFGKAPGVDRAADALRHAVYAGTAPTGGVVAFVGDDPSAKSSSIPSSSVGLLVDLRIPTLFPDDPSSCVQLGLHAVALSRYSGLWTAVRVVPEVADGTGVVDTWDTLRREDVVLPDATWSHRPPPDGRLLTPATLATEADVVGRRWSMAQEYAAANDLNDLVGARHDSWLGIATYGSTYGEVRAALGRLGLTTDQALAARGIRLLRMRMPFPIDVALVARFAAGLDEIVVVEEKGALLEREIVSVLYRLTRRPVVVGKFDDRDEPLIAAHGGLAADGLVEPLRSRLSARLSDLAAPAVAPRRRIAVVAAPQQRTPYYCSGCPHNTSTRAASGTVVGAGIGCHTMAMMMEPELVGDVIGLTPMGNEGAQWIGMADFVDIRHFVQNMGDGTYFHSGQLAITAAVAADVNVTFKVLYNGAVAMTGGQHPQGQVSVASLARILREQGVAEVIVTTDQPQRYRHDRLPKRVHVWHRDRIDEAQLRLAGVRGVTVLIHEQPCATELRRARVRGKAVTPTWRVVINERVCEGCGDCGRASNCLAVQPVDTAFGRKTAIDQSNCNFDASCLAGDCPSFVTVDTRQRRWRGAGGARVERASPRDLASLLASAIPDPPDRASANTVAVRIAGIGGTGVVTVARVIGEAARRDGLSVRGLDQVGLSQKAGPVVSDIVISRTRDALTNRIGSGQADVMIALDPLVAARDENLAVVRPTTRVVGSTSFTPTGEMIRHPERASTVESYIAAVNARTDLASVWEDLTDLAELAFGTAKFANSIGIGIAAQTGSLTITPAAVEAAIEHLGVAVAQNIEAFRLGRLLVVDRDAVIGELVPPAPPEVPPVARVAIGSIERVPEPLRSDVTRYANDLVGYQNAAAAETYLQTVAAVALADERRGDGVFALTGAVARNLYRVTAYKDEYEVARLLVNPAAHTAVLRQGGGWGRVTYHLHPPVLRALGMRRKLRLGGWARPLLRVLAHGKRVRGTCFDLFGRGKVRRLERWLVADYRGLVADLLTTIHTVDRPRYDAAVELAELPEAVRGYEALKLERLEQYRKDRERLLAVYRAGQKNAGCSPQPSDSPSQG